MFGLTQTSDAIYGGENGWLTSYDVLGVGYPTGISKT